MTSKKHATFDALIADSEPETKQVKVGDHVILVQELSGAHRFELAEKQDIGRWDLLLWVCMNGMIEPQPKTEDDLNKLKPEWVVQIATAIMDISGVSGESLDEAGEGFAAGNDTGGS